MSSAISRSAGRRGFRRSAGTRLPRGVIGRPHRNPQDGATGANDRDLRGRRHDRRLDNRGLNRGGGPRPNDPAAREWHGIDRAAVPEDNMDERFHDGPGRKDDPGDGHRRDLEQAPPCASRASGGSNAAVAGSDGGHREDGAKASHLGPPRCECTTGTLLGGGQCTRIATTWCRASRRRYCGVCVLPVGRFCNCTCLACQGPDDHTRAHGDGSPERRAGDPGEIAKGASAGASAAGEAYRGGGGASSGAPAQAPAEEAARAPVPRSSREPAIQEGKERGGRPRAKDIPPPVHRLDAEGHGHGAKGHGASGEASYSDLQRTKQRRIRVWRHTSALVKWCAGPEFGAHGLTTVPSTVRIVHPGAKETCGQIRISVANEDCLDRARWLRAKGHTVAVLNMACAHSPGGGVRWGAGAQEEELHRRTDLCRFLRDLQENLYPIGERTCLLSRGVTVFKEGETDAYRLTQPFKIDVITCAARAKPKLDAYGEYKRREDKDAMLAQIETILEAAEVAGCQGLVLSALGCGAYRHPPSIVAQLFRKAITERGGGIKEIYFSVLDDHNAFRAHNPEGNFGPFHKAFAEQHAGPPGGSADRELRTPPGPPPGSDLAGDVPACVSRAAAACGIGTWGVKAEERESLNRRGEPCRLRWWRFTRPGEEGSGEAEGQSELFHGCNLAAAARAVAEGVQPGPRQASRRAASPVAFAAAWRHVGGYLGPSATGRGHVGCALAVKGPTSRANNPHYRHAGSLEVRAVLLRPWEFNERMEITEKQSYSNRRLNPYQWDGADEGAPASPGAGAGRGGHGGARAGASGAGGTPRGRGRRHGAGGPRDAERSAGAEVADHRHPGEANSSTEDAADGEAVSESSSRTAKWAYSEEYRPQWVWDVRKGCWDKRNPCRCHRGPRYCLGYARKWGLFLCQGCHIKGPLGEVYERCSCPCDGCSGPPALAQAGPAAEGDPERTEGGERADSVRPYAGGAPPPEELAPEAHGHVPPPPPPHAVPRRAKRVNGCAGDEGRTRAAPGEQERHVAPQTDGGQRSGRTRRQDVPWHEVGVVRAGEKPGTLWSRTRSEACHHWQRLREQGAHPRAPAGPTLRPPLTQAGPAEARCSRATKAHRLRSRGRRPRQVQSRAAIGRKARHRLMEAMKRR